MSVALIFRQLASPVRSSGLSCPPLGLILYPAGRSLAVSSAAVSWALVGGVAGCSVGEDWLVAVGPGAPPPVGVLLSPPHAEARISTTAVTVTAGRGDQQAAIGRTFSSRLVPTGEDDGRTLAGARRPGAGHGPGEHHGPGEPRRQERGRQRLQPRRPGINHDSHHPQAAMTRCESWLYRGLPLRAEFCAPGPWS